MLDFLTDDKAMLEAPWPANPAPCRADATQDAALVAELGLTFDLDALVAWACRDPIAR